MTTVLYQEWLCDWDAKLQCEGCKILLFQDNFSVHSPPDDLTNIVVENFSANLIAHVQPADAGITHCFKAHYHACFMDCGINCYNSDIPPADVYNIDILNAMQLADIAWNEVDTTMIHNCWQKPSILPNTLLNPDSTPAIHISSLLNNKPANPVTAAEKGVSASLDHLEEIGVLQQGN
jgi:hypothetical protein